MQIASAWPAQVEQRAGLKIRTLEDQQGLWVCDNVHKDFLEFVL
jgi:hypothetical protein